MPNQVGFTPVHEPQFRSQPLEYSQGVSCLCRDSGVSHSPPVAAVVSSVQLSRGLAVCGLLHRNRGDGPGWGWSEEAHLDLPGLPVFPTCLQECANQTFKRHQHSPEVSTLLWPSWKFYLKQAFTHDAATHYNTDMLRTKNREPAICGSTLQESISEYCPFIFQDLPVSS